MAYTLIMLVLYSLLDGLLQHQRAPVELVLEEILVYA
jgi:hypothetical protein